MGTEKRPAYQTDRLFMKEADSFRFFLREVLLRGNCRLSAKLVKQRKLSYAKGRAAYLLDGHLKLDRRGYQYHDQSGPQWKDRVAEIYQLQTMTLQEMSGYLDLLRLLTDTPIPMITLLSRRRYGGSEDSYRIYLRELVEEGLVKRSSRSNRLFLRAGTDVFAGLDPAQQEQVAFLLEWAVAVAPYSAQFSTLRKIFRMRYPAAPRVPVVYQHLHTHPVLDELFYWPVCQAIRERRLLRIHYIRETEEESFSVIPLVSLFDVLYGRSYLYCLRQGISQVMILRYDRINRLELLKETFSPEETEAAPGVQGFRKDLPFVWNVSLTGERHLVRLRFRGDPGVEYRVRNEGRHGTVERQTDGSLLYQVQVTDWMEMKGWILGFGDQCEVLSPPQLRQEILSAWREILQMYGEEGNL